MVKITFVWHDCFVVQTGDVNLVFDYWLDADGTFRQIPSAVASLDRDIPLIVLVSHGHKDHFNRNIFGWASEFRDVRYVVSTDVSKRIRHIVSPTAVYSGPNVDASRVVALRHGNSFEYAGVKVTAFPSTDIGNSYLVETGRYRFFHAGDLNAWIWLEHSTEAEVRKAMGDYRACLRDIDAYLHMLPESDRAIDFCFFPVDSRIGPKYWTGASMFLRQFDVRRFFPMHFDLGDAVERLQRRTDALRFDLYANPERGEYIPLAVHNSLFLTTCGMKC